MQAMLQKCCNLWLPACGVGRVGRCRCLAAAAVAAESKTSGTVVPLAHFDVPCGQACVYFFWLVYVRSRSVAFSTGYAFGCGVIVTAQS